MSPFAHPQLLNSAPVQVRAEVAPLVAQAAGWTGCRVRTSAVLEVKSMLSMLWNMKNGKNWPNPMFVTCLSYLKLYPNFLPVQWVMLPFLLLPFQMLLLTHQGWQVTSQHAGDSPLASESCSMHGTRWSGYVWESLKKKRKIHQNSAILR